MTTLAFPAPHRHWRGGRGLFDGLRARWAEQRRLKHHARLEDELRGLWREACAGVGLCQYIAVAAGLTVRTPRFGAARVQRGRTTFTTELLPGGEPEDITKHALRLAHTLGFHGLRVDPIGGRWVRVVLLDSDPLRDNFGLARLTTARADETVILGRAEDGVTLGHALADAAHLAVQGQNGAGKSAFTYGLLSQVCAASDVLVAGSDITGLVLGRAWTGTAHHDWQTTGTRDLPAHAALLDRLVTEMDRRLDTMPPRRDKIIPTTTTPLVLVVLESSRGCCGRLRHPMVLGVKRRGLLGGPRRWSRRRGFWS